MKETNKRFAETRTAFRQACHKAGLEPTSRQASKFRRGRGLAWAEFTAFAARRPAAPTPTEGELFRAWAARRGVNPTKYQRKIFRRETAG